jgi:hypothetical protein
LGKEVALKEISFGSHPELEAYIHYAELAKNYDNIPTLLRLNSYVFDMRSIELNGPFSIVINVDYHPNNFG